MINYYRIQLGFGEGGSQGSYDRNIKKQNLFDAAIGFFKCKTDFGLFDFYLVTGGEKWFLIFN